LALRPALRFPLPPALLLGSPLGVLADTECERTNETPAP
jgi:hypothetical protein